MYLSTSSTVLVEALLEDLISDATYEKDLEVKSWNNIHGAFFIQISFFEKVLGTANLK